ncbi:MAG: hypothetical protein J2P46_06095 [Zavarzinella sp.]|nr:hypothetical protein [Zavarzinella sp.]
MVTDEGAERLANCPEAGNLELVDLSYNTLTTNGVAALKWAGIKCAAAEQWAPRGDEYEDNHYLYAGDYE